VERQKEINEDNDEKRREKMKSRKRGGESEKKL
jgi:hypothetical protein